MVLPYSPLSGPGHRVLARMRGILTSPQSRSVGDEVHGVETSSNEAARTKVASDVHLQSNYHVFLLKHLLNQNTLAPLAWVGFGILLIRSIPFLVSLTIRFPGILGRDMSQQRCVGSTIRLAITMMILSVILTLGAGRVRAQGYSSVTGVITDPQGAVMAGVDVTLSNNGTAFSATAKSNANGVYIFTEVPPAEGYSLTVSREGFRTITIDKVSLSVGTKETRDIQLSVGDVKVTIEVNSGGGATLDTSDASIGNTIDSQRVEDLPSLFRTNAAALMSLQPGVETDANDDARNGVVIGTRGDQSNITVDGLDVNDQRAGFAFTTVGDTPIDSVSEVHVIVGGNDASYGRSAGGQIELVTKSGTNEG